SRPHRLSLARSYAKIWSKLPQPLRKVLPAVSTEDTQYRAAEALLRAARPSAKALMPRLHPWLARPEQPRYLLALRLLGYIGEGRSEAVPFLVQALQSTNRFHRIFAVESLTNLGSAAEPAVPALIGALDDSSTQRRAIRALR